MRTYVLRAGAVALIMWAFSGCFVAPVPVGAPVYEPPVVVEEPPVATWRWGLWPHYEVEHHYIVDDERVIIRDRHYFPSYGRTRPYIRNDTGKHKGWYRHEDRGRRGD